MDMFWLVEDCISEKDFLFHDGNMMCVCYFPLDSVVCREEYDVKPSRAPLDHLLCPQGSTTGLRPLRKGLSLCHSESQLSSLSQHQEEPQNVCTTNRTQKQNKLTLSFVILKGKLEVLKVLYITHALCCDSLAGQCQNRTQQCRR